MGGTICEIYQHFSCGNALLERHCTVEYNEKNVIANDVLHEGDVATPTGIQGVLALFWEQWQCPW